MEKLLDRRLEEMSDWVNEEMKRIGADGKASVNHEMMTTYICWEGGNNHLCAAVAFYAIDKFSAKLVSTGTIGGYLYYAHIQ